MRDVFPFSVVMGVPAQIIRQFDPHEAPRDGQQPRVSAEKQAVLQWTR
jgi:serine acetyltransferase